MILMPDRPDSAPIAADRANVWWRRGLAIALVALGLVVLLISLAAVGSLILGPGLHRDQDLLARYLQVSRPGYRQVTTLAHEPGSTAAHRRLRIAATIDAADAPIACQGLFIYHHLSPPAWDLAWDAPACTQADETMKLARRILDGGSLRYMSSLYGEERAAAVQALLQHWLQNGTISAADIPGAENRALLLPE